MSERLRGIILYENVMSHNGAIGRLGPDHFPLEPGGLSRINVVGVANPGDTDPQSITNQLERLPPVRRLTDGSGQIGTALCPGRQAKQIKGFPPMVLSAAALQSDRVPVTGLYR